MTKEVMEYRLLDNPTTLLANILALYEDAGWSNYTKNTATLIQGLRNSLAIYGAFYQNELVGLIRMVGDGWTILYIQDILVLKAYQRQGIGTHLLEMVLSKYKHVRQIVLVTDNKENLIHFYQKSNLLDCQKVGLICFIKN